MGIIKIAAHDQAFFIRKRKHLASGERLIARTQTGGAHQSVHHNVGLFDARERSNRLRAKADLHAAVCIRETRVTRKLRIAERDIAHAELMRLSKHGIDAGVGREGRLPPACRGGDGHIECLRADRARRSQNNNFTRHAAFIRMSRISHFKPPLIRSESKALPRQKPMSRARARFRRREKSARPNTRRRKQPKTNRVYILRGTENSPRQIAPLKERRNYPTFYPNTYGTQPPPISITAAVTDAINSESQRSSKPP